MDHHGRSSRSPVMLFDIQENNNVNTFAVSRYRILHQAFGMFCSFQLLKRLPLIITLIKSQSRGSYLWICCFYTIKLINLSYLNIL